MIQHLFNYETINCLSLHEVFDQQQNIFKSTSKIFLSQQRNIRKLIYLRKLRKVLINHLFINYREGPKGVHQNLIRAFCKTYPRDQNT